MTFRQGQTAGGDAWARMYRVVHGWPMLAGIPVPLFLGLMLVGIVGGSPPRCSRG